MSIESRIKEARLKTLRRSFAATEAHEAAVSRTALATAAVITGTAKSDFREHLEEYTLREIYVRELERYDGKKRFGYSGQPFTPRGLVLWTRIVRAWKASGVSMQDYVKAQFAWFHEKFRKAPEPVQLATDEAVLRAATVAPKKVGSVAKEEILDVGALFSRCDKQIRDVMRAQKMTREEVYRKLVKPGILLIPEKFLRQDPVWKALEND